jgi:hypothetical protein
MLRHASGYEAFSEVEFSFTFLACLERVWSIVAGGPLKLVEWIKIQYSHHALFYKPNKHSSWILFFLEWAFFFAFRHGLSVMLLRYQTFLVREC